ncbi:glutathione S-transferase family protein [Nostoc sp. FACHB-280]|uniref:glutathione S-transferase family protein n=1 Tax=Nostoc sp. FACHB-280 TaxID=2692839 RepID=UPI00168BA5E8|nr:glutathione S-transferase family protein [Nostoc sp. FACHB-280]MBD2494547.1 glutathione S-transferase family protein [Nostoc sp. FACHB-280]
MAKLTVYGTPLSTYVRTVRLLLEETGVDYTVQDIDIFKGENQSPEYLAKNPFGKVPTLEVDGEVIYETPAITDYLNTVFANNQFSLSEPMLQARMRQIITIIDNYFYPAAISKIVIQRLIVPIRGGKPDKEQIQNAIAPAQKAIQAIESITVGSPYLLGSQLTIADFFLIPVFIYLSQTPEYEAITAQTPKLQVWWNAVKQLPNVEKVCA